MAAPSRICVFWIKENHEKGDDCRAGIDDELPSVGKPEHRAAGCPNDDRQAADQEGHRRTGRLGDDIRDACKKSVDGFLFHF